jgi:hypothetical protein
MSSEPSKNPKAYRTAAILFSISGLLFIIVFAVSGNIAFLPIGIAMFIISVALWQHGRKLADAVDENERGQT